MNRIIFAIVIILVIGVIGFLLISNRNSQKSITTKVTASPTQAPSPTPTPLEVTVNLKELNRSGESGTATLKQSNGKLMVSFNLTGAPAGVAQPAHIHVGTCPGVGAIKWPLTSVTDGKSDTTLPDGVTLETIKSSLPLSINVHKSTAQLGVYVACGSIEASSGALMEISGMMKPSQTPTSSTMKKVSVSPTSVVSTTPIVTP